MGTRGGFGAPAKSNRNGNALVTVAVATKKDAVPEVLARTEADALLGQFKKITRSLARLAMSLEAAEDPEGMQGIMDVISMLKEVQTECEARKAITLERRRAAVHRRRAARQATKAKPETGSITEDEADTTEGT